MSSTTNDPTPRVRRQDDPADHVVSPPRLAHLKILHPGRSRPPVIVIGVGELDCLKKTLPADVPLWWLKIDGFAAPPFTIRPFPEMAAAFAEEIRSVYPQGALSLVGYSFAALVALDLAHQLNPAEHPAQVLMVEPPLPGILPTRAKRRAAPSSR